MSARSCIGVALGAVVLGSILVSVSADAQPAQAPVNQPACTVSTASLCRQRCDHGATANYEGARACDELGRMYRDGTPGVAGGVGQANPAEATPLFTRSCYLGWSAGCLDLAVGYLKTGDSTLEPKARQAYEGGCLSGGARTFRLATATPRCARRGEAARRTSRPRKRRTSAHVMVATRAAATRRSVSTPRRRRHRRLRKRRAHRRARRPRQGPRLRRRPEARVACADPLAR